jgi:NDP-sugar pyrophosphorylase family protein
MECDVLLLCAGFGKRLGSITEKIPKPLVQVAGVSLLDRHLSLLKAAGCTRVIINLHYLGHLIKEHLKNNSRYNMEFVFSEEEPILDTGGAVKNIETHLKYQQLMIINCDSIYEPSFNYREVLDAHLKDSAQPLATLLLREDPNKEAYGTLGISETGQILSFLGETLIHGIKIERELMFAGISVLERGLIQEMPPAGSIFSLTSGTFRQALESGRYLSSYQFAGYWNDVGTPERLRQAEEFFE